MTDEEKGKGQDQNKPNETVQSLTAKLKIAQDADKAKEEQIQQLTEKLKAANDIIEANERAPLISDIVNRSSISVEELAKKPTEELKTMLATLNSAKAPTAKSVRSSAVDVQDKLEGLTVGSLLGKRLGER